MKEEGKLFVISGPSGVGKGTLVDELSKRVPDLKLSKSVTTRQPRKGEKPGKEYYFISEKNFNLRIKKNEFLEWALVYDNYYGTPYATVKNSLYRGEDVVLEIDVQGAEQVKNKVPDSILIFIKPPSLEELRNRLKKRKTEKIRDIELRIEVAKKEMELIDEFDFVVINDKIDDAIDELVYIIQTERSRNQTMEMKENDA